MAKSKYDELHDRYSAINTNKSGTRYERLAAVVFAALEERSIVIHDLKMVGKDSGVSHQIDVKITREGVKKHILLECKDFDVSGSPVGLGIARDFWGVVDDVHPDEAWIITCNEFTRDARRYAKGKGIKLATLRAFSDGDWENRVKTIVINLMMARAHVDRLSGTFDMDEHHLADFMKDYANQYPTGGFAPEDDKTALFDGTSTRSLSDIATKLARHRKVDDPAPVVVEKKETPKGKLSANSVDHYPIRAYEITVPVTFMKTQMRISAVDGATVLLLSGDDGLDFVVWGTALEAFTIDEDGTVHLAPEAVQKRLLTTVVPVPADAPFPDVAPQSHPTGGTT